MNYCFLMLDYSLDTNCTNFLEGTLNIFLSVTIISAYSCHSWIDKLFRFHNLLNN